MKWPPFKLHLNIGTYTNSINLDNEYQSAYKFTWSRSL